MTAFNPPSNLFFSGITFNPNIIEQGNTVVSGGGGGDVFLAGNNNFTGANSFTGGSIDVTTQTAGNNTTKAASTAFVNNAIAGVSGVSLTANNNFTGVNTFTGGIITSSIEANSSVILVDTVGYGTTFGGPVNCDYTFGCDNIDSRSAGALYLGSSGLGPTTGVIIGSDTVGVVIGAGATIVSISNLETVNLVAETIGIPATGYIETPSIYYNASNLTVGSSFTGVDLIGVINAPTVAYPNNSTQVATTEYVTTAITSSGVTLAGNNNWTGVNDFVSGTIRVPTQITADNTTLAASTAHVRSSFTAFKAANNTWTGTLNSFTGSAINMTTQAAGNNTTLGANTAFVTAAITALKAAANTWSGANNFTTQIVSNNTTLAATTAFVQAVITSLKTGANTFSGTNTFSGSNSFTTGSIDVATQIAGNSTTLAASTAFVTGAISALSSIYQTAAQVATAISTELTNFLGTSHVWTADQDLHLVDVYVKTQLQSVVNDIAASTSYVALAVTNGISTGYSNIMTNTNNFTGVNTFTNNTFVPTITTGTNTTQAASSAFVNASITAMKAAANTFSGANSFTTGSIDVTTQTAGNNTTLAASTAFVTAAISALSSVYRTAAQVTTAINSALTTFLATANTFTANQIFPTIQFSTGTLNQAFRIQHVDGFGFGAITANSSVTTTYSYTTLGLTNFTTFITATISNSSGAANGSRVLFTIQSASATSFTIVGFNVTGTNTAASAFTLVVYGR